MESKQQEQPREEKDYTALIEEYIQDAGDKKMLKDMRESGMSEEEIYGLMRSYM